MYLYFKKIPSLQKLAYVFAVFLAFSFIIAPMSVSAAGLVPCGGVALDGNPEPSCNISHLTLLVENVLEFLLFVLATPLFAIVFVYAGLLYLSSAANPSNREKAKGAMIKALAGFAIALIAWTVIATILRTLGVEDEYILLKDIIN